jgi:hypothetical protein
MTSGPSGMSGDPLLVAWREVANAKLNEFRRRKHSPMLTSGQCVRRSHERGPEGLRLSSTD